MKISQVLRVCATSCRLKSCNPEQKIPFDENVLMQLGTKELAIQHVHCVITLVATKLPRLILVN